MNVKTTIQLLIFLLIVIFIYFFVKNTFFKEQKDVVNLDLNKNETIKEITELKKMKIILLKI